MVWSNRNTGKEGKNVDTRLGEEQVANLHPSLVFGKESSAQVLVWVHQELVTVHRAARNFGCSATTSDILESDQRAYGLKRQQYRNGRQECRYKIRRRNVKPSVELQ